MERLTKEKLERALTSRLGLKNPEFMLEKIGGRIVGNIITTSFKGKQAHERQGMIWKALEAEFGQMFKKRVGMLLAYTPEEWDFGSEQTPKKKSRKAG
ncbi:MAG: hypothetical protein ACE15C_18140 [Phycisphaerae bacterium]